MQNFTPEKVLFVLLYVGIAIVILVIIYQPLYYWIFKDPVSVVGSVKMVPSSVPGKQLIDEISFTINNRKNKIFKIERIILKIDEDHHILDNNKVISYPSIVKGFETITLSLPIDFLKHLTKKEIEELRRMLVKISITIRGNNSSYMSNQINIA